MVGKPHPYFEIERKDSICMMENKHRGASVHQGLAIGCIRPTEHLLLCTLCIHFMILKDLDFAKIWICPDTKPSGAAYLIAKETRPHAKG